MSQWSADVVRKTFVEFFRTKCGHDFVPSSPCVPHDDPSLLFTNAGMNQFKPLFLNNAAPGSALAKLKRAVNSQKCIRAGGKHNDLEDVGKDTYHHTFFEMLGNWSFGDYFKAESITWGWELLTKVYGLPPERLYATYFAGNAQAGLAPDHEARELWLKFLPESHVIPGNMKDNFWEMGDTGPCGPCSEIHVDRIGGRDASMFVNQSDPDVIEIWNHVFIQYNREADGKLKPLPARHVDTGMGLERLVSVLQNVRSNYDTDVFAPIFLAIERATGARAYSGRLGAADKDNVDTAYRVIADHIRTLTFAITDGATPSNEGRGYVLRRILRRAVRYGTQVLGAKPGFFASLVPVVTQHMGEFFPELRKDPARVSGIIREEEESFGRTLTKGIVQFDEACVRAFQSARLCPHLQIAGCTVSSSRDEGGWSLAIHRPEASGAEAVARLRDITPAWADEHFGPARLIAADDAFRLYDTFGFPVDLTQLMAEERGLKVDMPGFAKLMEEAKGKARAAAKFSSGSAELDLPPDAIARLRQMAIPPTEDVDKFHGRDIRATVMAIWNGDDFDHHASGSTSLVGVILDRTNFYAEMGGQVADTGKITATAEPKGGRDDSDAITASSPPEFRVEHVHAAGGYVIHIGRVARKQLTVGDEVLLSLDHSRRDSVAANHTATHLLNLALRSALGPGVDQRGSLVAPDKLRFDFAFNRAATPEELAAIQAHVDAAVGADLPVYTEVMALEKARGILGLRAVFGEAYPDPVRVVSIGRSPADLLAERDEARAMQTSAEFCGGTHTGSTAAIKRFALISEEAVAKGIRRVTGVTGVPAIAAFAAADSAGQRLAEASRLSPAELASEIKQLSAHLDALTLPMEAKHRLRGELAALQEKAKAAGKAAAAGFAAQVVQAASAIAENPEFDATCIVTTIDAASDRDALTAAVNAIRQKRARSAVLLISPDESAGKLSLMASVPDALIKRGLNAGEWVKVAAAAAGGKGGGKPDLAQAGAPELTKLREALAAAKAHAFAKCPN